MKRVIFATACGALAFLLAAAFFVIRDVRAYARHLCAMHDVKHLGILIESYKIDHEGYPTSLKVLRENATPEYTKELAELQGHLGERSNYQPHPTGFTITVHGENCEYVSLTNGFTVVVGRDTNHVRIGVRSLPTNGSSR